jgi:hypothetical protein
MGMSLLEKGVEKESKNSDTEKQNQASYYGVVRDFVCALNDQNSTRKQMVYGMKQLFFPWHSIKITRSGKCAFVQEQSSYH